MTDKLSFENLDFPKIILASGSKIRAEILTNAGLTFDIINRPIDEASIKEALLAEKVPMRDIADALAETKSVRVSAQNAGLVIGADQIMVMDNQLFDKPKSIKEARERLLTMRGKTHELLGAVVISEKGQTVWRHSSKTRLFVRDFSEEFLDSYLEQEGDFVLKSVGGYRFEGLGANLFTKVEGDFFSILGLSLLPVLDFLRLRGAIQT